MVGSVVGSVVPVPVPETEVGPVVVVLVLVLVTSAARQLLDRGVLVNPVAFPAVPIRQGGLRISVTATHERSDIKTLVAALAEVVGERAHEAPHINAA